MDRLESDGTGAGECENSNVDDSRKPGVQRSRDSRSNDMGSSDVRVRERKRVEKSG